MFVLSAAITMIVGCSGGGSNNSSDSAQMMETPPPPPQQQDFTALVQDIFADTADETEPVPVNDLDLVFADQKNPAAFDALIK
jgi:hypothetical protein